MSRIDPFVEALWKHGGEKVVLDTGAKVALHVGGRPRTITTGAVGPKLLDAILEEIAPKSLADEVLQEGSHAFAYGCEHGDVMVHVQRMGSVFNVQLVPAQPQAAPRADATPPAAASEPGPRRVAAAAEPASGSDREVMERLLRVLVDQGCSDLHVSSGSPPLFRKDGSLEALEGQDPLSPERARAVLLSIAPPERLAEFEACGDTDFAYEIPGTGRFRANLFLDRKGAGGVFRIIPIDILTAEDLGLSEHVLDLCRLSKGLVLVTGPTGSGKSTTLAAMVDWINANRADHIITIEDPIEFVHENKRCLVNQREIGGHTKGFKSALRAALREDPDIVLVGELRDLETIEIAIETAETGHLVFGTLHTNTAASTVDRIIDQFPTDRQSQIRTMLSESLRGVIAQTLCRKKGGGRAAALEVLISNHAISNLIREGKTFQIPSVMQTGRKQGMATLNDALLDLVERDRVEPAEAVFRAVQKAEMAQTLKAKGYEVPEDLVG